MLTAEQIAERKNYIGASEAAAVLGLSRWATPLSVWAEKTGQILRDEDEDKDKEIPIVLGNALEDVVARMFMEETGKKVHRVNRTIYHPDHPFIACNLDREVYGEQVPVECKVVGPFMAYEWKGDEAPIPYIIQVQHQMACTGAQYAYLAVLIGNHRFIWKRVDRDNDIIAQMLTREVAFWNEFVVPKVRPIITKNDDETLAKLYSEVNEATAELGDEGHIIVEQLEALKQDAKVLDGIITEKENLLKGMLKEAPLGRSGDYMVMWRKQKRETIDSTRLKKEQPEIAKKFLKTTEFRKFEIKKIGGGK